MGLKSMIADYKRKRQEGRERRLKQVQQRKQKATISNKGFAHASSYYSIRKTVVVQKKKKRSPRGVNSIAKSMIMGYPEIYRF